MSALKKIREKYRRAVSIRAEAAPGTLVGHHAAGSPRRHTEKRASALGLSKPEVARLRWEVRSTPRCGHPICAFKSTRPAYSTHPARLAFGFGMKKMLEAAFPPMSKR
jgi:hypothetical protein